MSSACRDTVKVKCAKVIKEMQAVVRVASCCAGGLKGVKASLNCMYSTSVQICTDRENLSLHAKVRLHRPRLTQFLTHAMNTAQNEN